MLDFDLIESGVAQGAPRYMEWYGAFGLLVTLVWLYMEILRLLEQRQTALTLRAHARAESAQVQRSRASVALSSRTEVQRFSAA